MPGPEEDARLLSEAALRAGAIAKSHFGQDLKIYDKGAEGPVTVADLEIDAMLHDTLLEARSGYGWLSEETEDTGARLSAEHVFICDPIDGTRAFIEGGKSFSHSLAVARAGVVTAAAVFVPMKDLLYVAHLGGGATLNGAEIGVARTSALSEATVLTTKGNLQPHHWDGPVPEVAKAYRPSLAYRLALIGQGRFDAMMAFRPTWEWDVAAGALIVTEAGGLATDGRGQALRFNSSPGQVDGILAGGPAVHGALVERRAHAAR